MKPAGVAKAAKEAGIPCIAVCGSVGERINELYDIGFNAVFSIAKGPQTLDSAMKNGFDQLAHITEQVVRTFIAGKTISELRDQHHILIDVFINHGEMLKKHLPAIFKVEGSSSPFISILLQMYGKSNSFALCPHKMLFGEL